MQIDFSGWLAQYIEPEPNTGCWYWLGAVDRAGYARIQLKNRKMRSVHQMFYEGMNGPIPTGLEIHHTCAVRFCVNPRHLQVVTHKENILMGVSPSAINARKTTAMCGHRLIQNCGERRCWECRRTYLREYMRRWRYGK